jgi:cobyrinic acid a,c-diamide synthase
MAALRKRGLAVQGFKVGPDFIDPGFHQFATGRPSHNLDGWMLSKESNLEIFSRATEDADVAVVEGVMGLFDGKSAPCLSGTPAEMATWLDTANVLVLDAAAMAGSAAAIVHGFDTLIPEFSLDAVICNRVGSARHYGFLRDAISARCRPAAIGYLPKDANLSVPERHLGLHTASEWMTEERLAKLAESVASHLDLDLLLKLSSRPRLPGYIPQTTAKTAATRIAVARDSAFCFYYHENLQMLSKLGAELVYFSPVSAATLPPDLDGIYLGGGYPELHAEALSANACMRAAISEFAAGGGPIYAECGGFMYLTENLVDVSGKNWPMVGLFPTTCRMQPRLAKLGYVEVEAGDSPGWLIAGATARGHEFRYSLMDPMPDSICRTYREPAQGYRVRSVNGSYIHLHFVSCPDFAEQFVRACACYGAEKRK